MLLDLDIIIICLSLYCALQIGQSLHQSPRRNRYGKERHLQKRRPTDDCENTREMTAKAHDRTIIYRAKPTDKRFCSCGGIRGQLVATSNTTDSEGSKPARRVD